VGLNGRAVKKPKAGDGKARTMATAKGIADEHIRLLFDGIGRAR
jgi:hypothetical protein